MTERPAPVDHPIHALMQARFSPRAYTGAPITAEQAASLFEAARWAPSCFNEQPWHFLAARRDADPEGFAKLLSLLGPGNQPWAGRAAMIVVTVARRKFAANGDVNAVALYDLGAAAMQMVLQAQAMGLGARQMRGFDVERARTELNVPEDHDPVSCIAIGHPGPVEVLSEALQQREAMPRARKPQSAFVHGAGWAAK
jgi:nitroreductase